MTTKTKTIGQLASALRSSMKRRSPHDFNIPTQAEIKDWIAAQPLRCAYTLEALTMENVSIDHRRPLARGGNNHLRNLALTSKALNLAKGTMTENEFRYLLATLFDFEDRGRSVLARLRAAGRVFA